LAVLAQVQVPLSAIVVDSYVWLGVERPGLGARLYEALATRTPIIGVAKTAWHKGAEPEHPLPERRTIAITRGTSANPLFVTSAGIDVERAAECVRGMHGEHRIPTLLKEVDRIVRAWR
jgi:deoxyribonuclease V